MKNVLSRLINHEQLDREEARSILIAISRGESNHSQIASFLTVYMMRNMALDELAGFRDALLELCLKVDVAGHNCIDLCGTGGDGKNTFNISTLAAFVTAGAGVSVSKHGNYGVSSISGSSNVMEQLGIRFSNDNDFLKRCLDEANICILHAPLFHPAMKNVAPIRRELGIKTFFNMLGPMVNPAFPKNQLIGVFNLELARMYSYLYQQSRKKYAIVHAMDGYDEISLTCPTKIITNCTEQMVYPSHFDLQEIEPSEIHGGETVKESAAIFLNILKGSGSKAQQDVVCANAGVAIAVVEECTLPEGFEKAKESLISGKALNALVQLQKLSSK